MRFFSLWLIFLFISMIVFGQTLNNFFVSDDFHWLVIARDTSIDWQIFLTNYIGNHQGGSYNPLLVLLFKFFYTLFHDNYFGYHLVSIILYTSNALLVYILTSKIFELVKIVNFKKLALVSALLFLFYPIHVETIAWLAAWPHLWVTFFYLLSLIFYFSFRQNNAWQKLAYSFIFFTLALLVKEIAISLPLVIIIWEVYFQAAKNKTSIKAYYYLPIYFIILALFLLLRYQATGIVAGYYASSSINFAWLDWSANLAAFGGDFVSFGFWRTLIYKVIYHYQESVVIISFVALASYFLLILRKKRYLQFTTFVSLLFILGPVLVTGLHRTTFAGERYLYLASVFFVIWLSILYQDLKINFKFIKYILALLFIIFVAISSYKLDIWEQATSLSKQIVASYSQLNIDNKQKLISVALPDNLSGAEVFRNNLQQALEIYYPSNYPAIITTQAYLAVNKNNKNKQLLKWRQDERGWLAESIDGSFVVTGITSISKDGLYWELWNYNYQNYKANIIRLLPSPDVLSKLARDEIKILIFDQGKLRLLE
ncbi:MAG: glycosyltransferase family 39 protein [Patescibacteria group bacterium]|jgi:hypothetical protein